MELSFECPGCEAVGLVPGIEACEVVRCSHCGHEREVRRGAFDPEGGLGACAWCATPDLYLQKDFPHGLGLAIVIVGFAAGSIFWYLYMPIWTFAVFLATAMLDLVLYYLVPDVTICYRCLSQFRGQGSAPEGRFAPFDLAIGERYRQERLRIEELRAARSEDA